MSEPEKVRPVDYSPIESEAVLKSINKYTYCLIIENGPGNGTAIPFKVGDKLFLLTAGHVLNPQQNSNATYYQLVRKYTCQTLKLKNPIIHFDTTKDIGVIQLLNHGDISDIEFIEPKNVLFISNDQIYNILISGFPNEIIIKTHEDIALVLAHSMSLNSIKRTTWHDPIADPYAESDIFCKYSEGNCCLIESRQLGRTDTIYTSPEKLHGISGGGMWANLLADTKLGLRVPYPMLVGIEKSVLKNQWIRGVLIKDVMEFLISKYPELHDGVYNKIPKIELNAIEQ